jgi:ribosomal protein S18 acetylase RimI-like enzyme
MSPRDGVTVRQAGSGDEAEVARFREAFDYDVIPDETRRFLADERHILLLGYVDALPAGFVSGVELFHPDKRAELFLYEIGVVDAARRRGLARALIEELKRLGKERGCAAMWVLTDEANAAAVGLYERTGGRWDGNPSVMYEYDLGDG